MVTHLARYRSGDDTGWGVVVGSALTPLAHEYPTTAKLITGGRQDWSAAARRPASIDLAAVQLLSPITTPCRVICQGANYRQHAIEAGMNPDERTFNLFFDKTDAAITDPTAPVTRPAHVRLLDYEIELALVIGAPITAPTTVTPENLHEFVFGLTIANDLSARDVQLPQGQFLKGKSYRGFCPVGPFLAVPESDEYDLLNDLELSLSVNGIQRQHDNTRNMLYRPAETLTELSEFCDLGPGDLVLTGTPHGCVATSPPALVRRLATALLPEHTLWAMFVKQNISKPYLKPGDVITASIRNASGAIDLGAQHTTITSPTR
ncbi:fumarylacetoacetate hydrolase family protein [Mycobacterium sp. 852002-51057_SCH5723018]|uniref:fumarylacetoacetate hydrolase family protein n=1 Tax=Mycobacterium sp. 852002-51057_SCH5723018 TaxID=1834094 RepID=UPI0008019033|nr:fumarylacetoacetate hydrolase family protein [Mycobacterium sp. 852002-51057_SCH5723018]OBG29681.1 fumarylacetoacetate hydrolase [Mycobacterium sp. 852002-51057_SCH5723018]